MELLTSKPSEPPITKKRRLDDSGDCDLVEFRKLKTRVQEAPDFPHGDGITEAETKSVKNLKNAESNLGKISFNGKEKFGGSQHFENNIGSSHKSKEFVRNKPCFSTRPPGKVKFLDPRSLKKGHAAQKLKVRTTVTRRTPLKNVGSNLSKEKQTSYGKEKLVEFQPLKNNKRISFKPKELERSKSYLGTRRNRKVMFLDSMEEGDARKLNFYNVLSDPRKEQVTREKIKEAMIMFDEVNERLYEDNKMKPRGEKIAADWRVPFEAAKIVKQKLKWRDPEKMLGPICGVQIGDKFKYRSQLHMIGLHCQPHSGIDYVKIGEKNLAISVVDSHRYLNESGFRDKMIYCGHGGFGFFGTKVPPQDQKLERGNMALRNSMIEKTPVRMIRKVQGVGNSGFYVYDGLYVVSHYVQKRSEEGKTVFKFHLHRVPGQPPLQIMVNGNSRRCKVMSSMPSFWLSNACI